MVSGTCRKWWEWGKLVCSSSVSGTRKKIAWWWKWCCCWLAERKSRLGAVEQESTEAWVCVITAQCMRPRSMRHEKVCKWLAQRRPSTLLFCSCQWLTKWTRKWERTLTENQEDPECLWRPGQTTACLLTLPTHMPDTSRTTNTRQRKTLGLTRKTRNASSALLRRPLWQTLCWCYGCCSCRSTAWPTSTYSSWLLAPICCLWLLSRSKCHRRQQS